MQPTPYIWKNGSMIPWQDATVHVLSHGLHYGTGAFEGIRCYETAKGPAILQLQKHIDRLYYSCGVLRMNIPYTKAEFSQACIDVVRENAMTECYLRPLVFYGQGKLSVDPIGNPLECIIGCWAWGKLLGKDSVSVRVSDYIRIHPKSMVTDAKISGHYVNCALGCFEVHDDPRYDESLFLDYAGNIAEGPGENFFMVKDGTLITPSKGTILPGITREFLMQIAQEEGIRVAERAIKPEELATADECFFSGTAAEVTAIVRINDRPVGSGDVGPITKKLNDIYTDAIHGRIPKYGHILTPINA